MAVRTGKILPLERRLWARTGAILRCRNESPVRPNVDEPLPRQRGNKAFADIQVEVEQAGGLRRCEGECRRVAHLRTEPLEQSAPGGDVATIGKLGEVGGHTMVEASSRPKRPPVDRQKFRENRPAS